MRKPLQGVRNIVRFNWHYYILSVVAILSLLLISNTLSGALRSTVVVFAFLIVAVNFLSLSVSFYVYDLSSLYKFHWLDRVPIGSKLINVNAGFDETGNLLINKYATADFTILDFYDPTKHTEVSIKRARKAYPQLSRH